MTLEDDDERFEQGLDWYKDLTDFQKEHRAIQWRAARGVLERERLARIKPIWADPDAKKFV
jgi:hypothetical protein